MCLDDAYDITWVYHLLLDAGFTPHVCGRREEMVQRTHGHRQRGAVWSSAHTAG
jgi:hypothetical protein